MTDEKADTIRAYVKAQAIRDYFKMSPPESHDFCGQSSRMIFLWLCKGFSAARMAEEIHRLQSEVDWLMSDRLVLDQQMSTLEERLERMEFCSLQAIALMQEVSTAGPLSLGGETAMQSAIACLQKSLKKNASLYLGLEQQFATTGEERWPAPAAPSPAPTPTPISL
jgi:hypothetical protein